MDDWKTSFLLGWPSFRCYVSFREGIYYLNFVSLDFVGCCRFFQLFGRRLDGEVLAVPVSSRPRRFGGRFQISLVEQTELVCYTWVEKIFEKCYVSIDYRYHIVISSYVYT